MSSLDGRKSGNVPHAWIYNKESESAAREGIRYRHRRYTDAEGQTEERRPVIQKAKDQAVFSF